MPHYGDLQTQIYGAGLSGIVPTYPVDFATLEKRAQSALPPPATRSIAIGNRRWRGRAWVIPAPALQPEPQKR